MIFEMSDFLGIAGSYLFLVVVVTVLFYLSTWGELSRKEEAKFIKADRVDIITEEGITVTVVRQADETKKIN